MLNYQQNIVPKWVINGHPLYFIDDQKVMRNVRTGKPVKRQLKGYTIGYYLNRKFYSLNQIRPMLKRYEETNLPF